MVYAARTDIPADRSRADIEKTLAKYGATRFAYATEANRATIMFEAKDRRLRFDLPLPVGVTSHDDQLRRSRWRALLLCIKAKLEAVDSKIETFEEAFLAHVVLQDGGTVYEHTREPIALSYSGASMQPLLPGPKSR